MPPFNGAERLRVTPKSEREQELERSLRAKIGAAHEEADRILPFQRTRRENPTVSTRAVYQVDGQAERGEYTRAWLMRSGADRHHPIQVHTDVVRLDGEGNMFILTPEDGTEQVGLTSNSLSGRGVSAMNVEQKSELADAAMDTIAILADQQSILAIAQAQQL